MLAGRTMVTSSILRSLKRAHIRPRQLVNVTLATRSFIHSPTSRLAQQQQELPTTGGNVLCEVIDSKVSIQWPDGRTSLFDHQYLFDHCRCERCFHPQTRQRLKTLGPVSPNIQPSSVTFDNGLVNITWDTSPTPHASSFPLPFLKQASYDPPLVSRSEILDKAHRITWGSSIKDNPPTVSYESVMPASAGASAEDGVLSWLNNVYEYGFCFVTGVPVTPEATEDLIRRMSHIRETHYGGFWDFTADMSKGDLAYSNEGLPAHTDTAYFTDPAGLQIFHCLSHPIPPGSGGETLLVDGFYVAQEIEKHDPTAYATLSRLFVPFHASGNEGTVLRPPISQPILRHDHLGQLQQVRWNNEDRCVLGEGWTPNDIQEWYTAARLFEKVCTSKEAEYWVKLSPGTVVVIDNWRVMHGRAAFTGQRRMCGAYVGTDDWRSRRRALIQKAQGGGKGEGWNTGW